MENHADREEEDESESSDKSEERTSGVGKEDESEEDEYPYSTEIVVFFFRADMVNEESEVDEDEVGCRIRSVKYSLESAHIRLVDPVINRRRSSEAPVVEIRRVTEVDEDGLSENESNKKPEDECYGSRVEKESDIRGYRSRQELHAVFHD